MVVAATSEDLLVSAAITGTKASWLRASLQRVGLNPDSLGESIQRNYTGVSRKKRWNGIWAAGQGVGRSRAIEPVADIVDELEREYRVAVDRFKKVVAE